MKEEEEEMLPLQEAYQDLGGVNGEHFKEAAARCGENLARAGGVQRAVKLVLAATDGAGRLEFGSVARAGA